MHIPPYLDHASSSLLTYLCPLPSLPFADRLVFARSNGQSVLFKAFYALDESRQVNLQYNPLDKQTTVGVTAIVAPFKALKQADVGYPMEVDPSQLIGKEETTEDMLGQHFDGEFVDVGAKPMQEPMGVDDDGRPPLRSVSSTASSTTSSTTLSATSSTSISTSLRRMSVEQGNTSYIKSIYPSTDAFSAVPIKMEPDQTIQYHIDKYKTGLLKENFRLYVTHPDDGGGILTEILLPWSDPMSMLLADLDDAVLMKKGCTITNWDLMLDNNAKGAGQTEDDIWNDYLRIAAPIWAKGGDASMTEYTAACNKISTWVNDEALCQIIAEVSEQQQPAAPDQTKDVQQLDEMQRQIDEMMERVQIYDGLQATSTLKMKIPNEKVGLVIGKGGVTIKQFTHESQCTINIPDLSEPGQKHRVLTLTGTPHQIVKAQHLIKTKVGTA